MPSRIDIGPEGGPFVAINENSNDLELQDINGNVIAVWDETEGQWDLNNNSLTNINAIDASSATLELLNADELSTTVANGVDETANISFEDWWENTTDSDVLGAIIFEGTDENAPGDIQVAMELSPDPDPTPSTENRIGQIWRGFDSRSFESVGPFKIPPGASVKPASFTDDESEIFRFNVFYPE